MNVSWVNQPWMVPWDQWQLLGKHIYSIYLLSKSVFHNDTWVNVSLIISGSSQILKLIEFKFRFQWLMGATRFWRVLYQVWSQAHWRAYSKSGHHKTEKRSRWPCFHLEKSRRQKHGHTDRPTNACMLHVYSWENKPLLIPSDIRRYYGSDNASGGLLGS